MILEMAADGLGDRRAVGDLTYADIRAAARGVAARLGASEPPVTTLALLLPNGAHLPVALFGAWSGLGAAWAAAFGATAVLGHVFSPFVGFRGGKGVATAAGMFIALAPLAVAIALPVWGLSLWLTGYVSVSSIVASVTFPVWVRLTEPAAQPAFYASLGLAGLIVFSHRANIRRLLAGTENRFRTRKEIHA